MHAAAAAAAAACMRVCVVARVIDTMYSLADLQLGVRRPLAWRIEFSYRNIHEYKGRSFCPPLDQLRSIFVNISTRKFDSPRLPGLSALLPLWRLAKYASLNILSRRHVNAPSHGRPLVSTLSTLARRDGLAPRPSRCAALLS